MTVSPRSTTQRQRVRVVGYVRVSTKDQAEEGLSLEAQRERIAAWAVAQDVLLVAVFEDAGVSAKNLDKRPGLRAALSSLDRGDADGLLVAKLDRLTRSVKDLGGLLDTHFAKRFSLLSVGDAIDTRTASGRLVLNVLGSVSQWEREAIGERTKETLQMLKSQGVRLGNTPLGVRRTEDRDREGRLVVATDETETAVVRRIFALRELRLSTREIATVLTTEGHPTRQGGQWGPSTVRNVLRRARTATPKDPPTP